MKFLLIFFLVVYLIGQLFKYFFKRFMTKAAQQGNFHQSSNQNYKTRKEGEVTVDNASNGKKFYDNKMGEYVDYEEAE